MIKKRGNIAIVIPTLNSSVYIEKNVLELINFMIQNFEYYAIIVVNDCSEDDTLLKLMNLKKEFKNLKIVDMKNRVHQRLATTIGYTLAESKYVLTLDDDAQFKVEDILTLYNEITNNKEKSWVVSGYYDFESSSKKYSAIRNFILIIFNYLFFPNYRKTKYFSSFKIFNKELLDKMNATNIYHFWDIPSNKIAKEKVSKQQTKTIRPSNYNFINYWKVLNHVVAKLMQKILLILFFFFLLLKKIIVLVILIIIYLLIGFVIFRDKYMYKNKGYYEVY